MKLIRLAALAVLVTGLFWACNLDDTNGPGEEEANTPKLFINEFMASNDAATVDPDEDGNDGDPYEDWFEIYNADSVAVDVGGMYVTDDLGQLNNYQIPKTNSGKTTIQPDSFLVIWADKEMHQGVTHVDFALSGGGEAIGLAMSDGRTLIDSYTYGPQQTDVSYGRSPDGSDTWKAMGTATPGAPNSGAPSNTAPEIKNISVSPDTLTASTPVIITADIIDAEDNLASVTITYGPTGALTSSKAMSLTGAQYQADLGTFADGSRIFFFISAADDQSKSAVSDTLSFEVGYIAPVLYINEFMASNDAANADEYGEFEDWIEIYNPGTKVVDIGGMYITDGLDDLTAWQIPDRAPDSTTIQPGGFLLLYADKQPEQGILHVNVKLSGGGEQIGLTAPNGTTVIDSLTYDAGTASAIGFGLDTDKSCARQPDGSSNWQVDDTPTPGTSNN